MEIIDSEGYNDCTVKFSDGTIIYSKSYDKISSGSLKNPNHRINEKHDSTEGYEMTIIECTSANKYTIKFNDERQTIKKNVMYKDIFLGHVKNLYHRSNMGSVI